MRAAEGDRGVALEIAGTKLVFVRDTTSLHGDSEQQRLDVLQMDTFARLIRPNDIVADVGAYRGEFTTVAALRGRRVVSFEPNVDNHDYIERNARLNGCRDRIELVLKAVGDETGARIFYSQSSAPITGSLYPTASSNNNRETSVDVVTLDDFFRDARPRVVKIDAEGAEWAVLRGAERIVRSDADIICELHPWVWNSGDEADAMRQWLRERGRVVWDLANNCELARWRFAPVLLKKAR